MEQAPCETVRKDGAGDNATSSTGAASREPALAIEELHRLLAEANLLRIRKQLDDAVGVCTRVLRLDPSNATAHSLMGDIHRDEGNDREALGWYKLAVQLDPKNAVDRKKLDETIDRVFQNVKQTADGESAEPAANPASNGKSTIGAAIRAWLEKITPTHVIILFFGLAVIVVAIILLLPSSGNKSKKSSPPSSARQTEQPSMRVIGQPQQSGDAATGTGQSVTPPAADGVENGGGTSIPGLGIMVQPGDNGAGKATAGGTTTQRSTTPSSKTTTPPASTAQVPPFDPPAKGRMSSADLGNMTAELRGALEDALKSSKLLSTLDDVTIDPRTSTVTLEYTIPHMETAMDTKQGLLYTGFHLIWAADKANGTLRAYVLRGSAYQEGSKVPSLALQADVSPQQADAARDAGDYKTVAKYLSGIWWRGDLDAAPL